MTKKVMRRRAADNVYLHKDFHGALNQALLYLHKKYGERAVRDYLRQFARNYHAPLRQALVEKGLVALKDYFERIYGLEGAECRTELSPNELTVTVPRCPAVTHIRKMGWPLAPLFQETSRTIHEAICRGTPYKAELIEYDPKTGRSVQRFLRRSERPI